MNEQTNKQTNKQTNIYINKLTFVTRQSKVVFWFTQFTCSSSITAIARTCSIALDIIEALSKKKIFNVCICSCDNCKCITNVTQETGGRRICLKLYEFENKLPCHFHNMVVGQQYQDRGHNLDHRIQNNTVLPVTEVINGIL